MRLFTAKYTIPYILGIILITAVILRLVHLADFSFSNDELSALFRIQYDRFRDLVHKGFFVDGHPGGIQVLLYYWVQLAGTSEWAVRLPFAVAGILSVYFSYLVGKKWFNPVTGLFTAMLVAILQFPLLYSQIARPYATGLLFVLMTAYYWTRVVFDYTILSKRSRAFILAGYILSTTLCMYNHYFSFLMAAIIGLSGLLFIRRANMIPYLFCGVVSIFLFLPHLSITLNHLRIGGVGLWLGKPSPDWIFQHIFYIFNESVIMLIVVIGSVLWVLWNNRKHIKFNKLHLLALSWFLIPFLTGFFYSRIVNPVLQHSVLLFSMPFLLLFFFSFFRNNLNRLNILLMSLLFSVGIYSLLLEKSYYQSQHFGEFREIARKVAEWDQQYGKLEITRAINVNHPWYIDFYLKQFGSDASFTQYENKGGMDLLDLRHMVEQSSTPFFLYAWTKPTLPETEDIVRTFYPHVVSKINYSGLSAIGLYAKEAPATIVPDPEPVFVVKNGFESPGRWNADAAKMDTSRVYTGMYSYRIDSVAEYSPAFDTILNKISRHSLRSIKVTFWALIPSGLSKTPIVLSVDDTKGENYIWASMNMEYFLDEYIWGKVIFNYDLSAIRSVNDRLKIYIWNPGRRQFYIDEMEIRFYE